MEDDLDWLARNVRVWPLGDHEGWYCVVTQNNCEKKAWYRQAGEAPRITKDQWLARRSELQNKPSWKDAPEWAEWLAQDIAGLDGLGAWRWYGVKPTKGDRTWSSKGHSSRPAQTKGEVLGDWRDTLERRPEAMITTVSQEGLEQFAEASMEAIATAEPAQATFSEVTDWYEHGELPPVGTACEAFGKFPTAPCEIIAYSPEQVAIRWLDNGLLDVIDLKTGDIPSIDFRPIRTERQLTVDEMMAVAAANFGNLETCCEALYDAGYRKQISPAK